MGKNIEVIDAAAFNGCEKLDTADLSATVVKTIGNKAFSSCVALNGVKFPETLNKIGNHAFYKAALGKKTGTESLVIPKAVTSIGYSAFEDCDYLGSVEFEDVDTPTATGILFGEYAEHNSMFKNCDRLTDIKLSNNIKTVPASFASYCKELLNVEWGKNIEVIDNSAFKDCEKLDTADLSKTQINKIERYAFDGCLSLHNLIFPNTIEWIGDYAFRKSALGSKTGTEEIVIPKSVSHIGYFAFENCDYLGSVIFEDIQTPTLTGIEWAYYADENAAFRSCDRLTKIKLSNNVRTVPSYFAKDCKALKSVEWGENTEVIGHYAFAEDEKLETGDFSKIPLEEIDTMAFCNCAKLHNVKFPETMQIIGDKAFLSAGLGGDTGLEKLIIPKSVTKIGYYAFKGALYLGEVEFESPEKPTLTGMEWGYYAEENAAFSNCKNLTKIKMSNNIRKVPSHFADKCSALTTVEFGENVDVVEAYAFRGAPLGKEKELGSISLSDRTKSIGNRAFAECTLLGKVVIGDSEDITLGEDIFMNCKYLTYVDIPQWVEKINKDTFYSTPNLKYLIIRGKNTAINCDLTKDHNKLTIYCSSDSKAAAYAKEHGIKRADLSNIPANIEYPKVDPKDVPEAPEAPIDDTDDNEEGQFISFDEVESENGSATTKGKIVVDLKTKEYTYTGEPIVPSPVVYYSYATKKDDGSYTTYKKIKLANNSDYRISYSDNVDASDKNPLITIKGMGDYSGTISTNFIIKKKSAAKLTMGLIEDIKAASLSGDVKEYIESQVVVYDGIKVVDKSEYTTEISESTDVKGNKVVTVKAIIKGTGNYTGLAPKALTTLFLVAEDKLEISSSNISVTINPMRNPLTYDGKAKKPKITVMDTTTGIKVAPKNYKVIYGNNINATSADNKAYVYIIGKKDYCGHSAKLNFDIEKKNFAKVSVAKLPKIMIRSSFDDINPIIKDGKKVLVRGVDYELGEIKLEDGFSFLGINTKKLTYRIYNLSSNYYSENRDDKGEYKESTVTVIPRSLGNKLFTKVSVATGVLVGGKAEPQVVVKYAGRVLTKDVDYTLKYSKNTKSGATGTVKVTGCGNYRGSVSKKFKIR